MFYLFIPPIVMGQFSTPFNLPVGVKANSMGGAFTAVADDCTAVFWNPAGLSSITGIDFENGNISVIGIPSEYQVIAFLCKKFVFSVENVIAMTGYSAVALLHQRLVAWRFGVAVG